MGSPTFCPQVSYRLWPQNFSHDWLVLVYVLCIGSTLRYTCAYICMEMTGNYLICSSNPYFRYKMLIVVPEIPNQDACIKAGINLWFYYNWAKVITETFIKLEIWNELGNIIGKLFLCENTFFVTVLNTILHGIKGNPNLCQPHSSM